MSRAVRLKAIEGTINEFHECESDEERVRTANAAWDLLLETSHHDWDTEEFELAQLIEPYRG